MPLVYLFLVCLVIAINPALLVLGLVLWLLCGICSRQQKIELAGANAMFGGSSAVDAAVLKGRRRL